MSKRRAYDDGQDTRLLALSIVSGSSSALFSTGGAKAWEAVSSNPLPTGFWFTFCSEGLTCRILKEVIFTGTGRTKV